MVLGRSTVSSTRASRIQHVGSQNAEEISEHMTPLGTLSLRVIFWPHQCVHIVAPNVPYLAKFQDDVALDVSR